MENNKSNRLNVFQTLRNTLVRSTSAKVKKYAPQTKPVYSELLLVCKSACDQLVPLIKAIYEEMHKKDLAADTNTSELTSKKPDNSFFTIADGLVSELLTKYLLAGEKFHSIISEEDSSNVNISTMPYTVDTLKVPPFLYELLDKLKLSLDELNNSITSNWFKTNTSVFIDPIDATKSFVRGQGEHCTILIGFVDVTTKRPVAGVCYRPLTPTPTFAFGCKAENICVTTLDLARAFNTSVDDLSLLDKSKENILGAIREKSDFIINLMSELNANVIRSGGVGNKALQLIEELGDLFVFDNGPSRWDTCAPEAVIEASGGEAFKLSSLLFPTKPVYEKYLYDSNENMDVETITNKNPELEFLRPEFNRYNTKNHNILNEKINEERLSLVNKYSNLCGLVAVNLKGKKKLEEYVAAMRKVATQFEPHFN